MNSGWASKVGNPLAFKVGASFPNYHFPGFGLEAAMWLVENRDVTAIRVDTLSLDPGNSPTFLVHVNFLRTDRTGSRTSTTWTRSHRVARSRTWV